MDQISEYICVLCICLFCIWAIVWILCYPHIKNKETIRDMDKNIYITNSIFDKMDKFVNGDVEFYDDKSLAPIPDFEDVQWELWNTENKYILKNVMGGVVISVFYVIFLYMILTMMK